MTRIRSIVVDDEPLARERIRGLLEEEPDLEVVAECGSARSAVDTIRSQEPDLIFLDVQMPDGTGFDVIREIGAASMPIVIFTTAYDEFALHAFEANALDYLLKPFGAERFRESLQRARRSLRRERAQGASEDLQNLLNTIRATPDPSDHVLVRVGSRLRLVPKKEIDWIEAEGNYLRLHTGKTSHLVRATLAGFEETLDPRQFVRIHRSTIVNVGRIREVESVFQGEYVVLLDDGTKLSSSRSYRERLEKAIGLRE